jgi:hypothetical protein
MIYSTLSLALVVAFFMSQTLVMSDRHAFINFETMLLMSELKEELGKRLVLLGDFLKK